METRNVESIFTIVGGGQRERQERGPGGMLRAGQRCDTGATRTPGASSVTGIFGDIFAPTTPTTQHQRFGSQSGERLLTVFYFLQFVLKSKDINLICVSHRGVPFQKVMIYSWITQNIFLHQPFGGFFCTGLIIDTDEAICSDIDISKSESEAEVHIRLSRDPGPHAGQVQPRSC